MLRLFGRTRRGRYGGGKERARVWLEARMLAGTQSATTIAEYWLSQFETALAVSDDVLLKTLFHADSYWRDLLALTWHIRTVNGLEAILRELKEHVGPSNPTDFRTDPNR